LPTLADQQATRRATPKGTPVKTPARAKPGKRNEDKAFHDDVWRRDRSVCRRCGTGVRRWLSADTRQPLGDVHHLHGRVGDLRYEPRAALLLCPACHERVTGTIGKPKVHVVATKTFTIRQGTFTDARFPVRFTEAP
jgi:hypothetical protein